MTVNGDLDTGPVLPAGAVLSVSQLHEDVRSALAGAGLGRVWVSGVVTGLRRDLASPAGSLSSTATTPPTCGPCSRWGPSPGIWPRSRVPPDDHAPGPSSRKAAWRLSSSAAK